MSKEEFDRGMAYIVEQRAQFASCIQQLREAQSRTAQAVAQTCEMVNRLANTTLEGKDVNTKMKALVDSQVRTDEQIKRTGEQLRRTAERLKNLRVGDGRRFREGRKQD